MRKKHPHLSPAGWAVALFALTQALSQTTASQARELQPGGENYQSDLNSRTLMDIALRPDPSPEGKRIERILVVSKDAITRDDPWPFFLSDFHKETRSEVIERELLFKTGDRWNAELIAETERNLRNNLFVSVANLLPCQGSAPDKINVVVLTKDLWSLRLNSDFSYVGSSLDYLELQLEEANLAGYNKDAKIIFRLDPGTLALSQEYSDPRVLGSRVAAIERGGVIVNRESRQTEGGVARIDFGQPLYSLDTKSGWSLSLSAQKDIHRLYSGGQVANYQASSTGETMPFAYDRRLLDAQAGYVLSFGRSVKQNFTFGWKGKVSEYAVPIQNTAPSAGTLNEFRQSILPYSESYGALFARYDLYGTQYRREIDIHTFALDEDFLLGPTATLETQVAQPVFGWSSSFFQQSAKIGFASFSGDDYLSAQASGSIRYQPALANETPWVNRIAQLQLRNISPRFGIFRLHTAGRFIRRSNDLNRTLDTLGGDGYLRGYPTNYFTGSQLWDTHFELRTLPVSFSTTHVGAAAFVDMGDAFNTPSDVALHASVGVGLRFLFPQFNRHVLRIDLGFPLEAVGQGGPSYWVAQFGQGF